MSDGIQTKELQELQRIAKAAGYAVRPWPEANPDCLLLDGKRWNPRRNGSDAFSLAVKLGITLVPDDEGYGRASVPCLFNSRTATTYQRPHKGDPESTARELIFMCALFRATQHVEQEILAWRC
jgi:hypothetical protein